MVGSYFLPSFKSKDYSYDCIFWDRAPNPNEVMPFPFLHALGRCSAGGEPGDACGKSLGADLYAFVWILGSVRASRGNGINSEKKSSKY